MWRSVDAGRSPLKLPLLLVFVAAVTALCGARTRHQPHSEATGEARLRDKAIVVLITVDGVRWQEVFQGAERSRLQPGHTRRLGARELMPHLHALLEQRGAAIGAPGRGQIRASGSNYVSLPGYMELLSGHASECTHNECESNVNKTLLDELAAQPELPSDKAVVVSSWPNIARALGESASGFTVSTGQPKNLPSASNQWDAVVGRLQEQALKAGAFPGDGEFRPDVYTSRLALHYLKTYTPRFLFLGLGEPDEYAHRDDYAAYLQALEAADTVIGQVDAELQSLESQGFQTLLLITTDHGRADNFVDHGGQYPESARGWLVAAGSSVGARGRVFSPRERHLADIAPTIRAVLGLAQDTTSGAGDVLSELELSFEIPPRRYAKLVHPERKQ